MAQQDRYLTPRQEAALRFLAVVERTNLAEQRRRAIRARADEALQNPHIAAAVDAAMEHQIQRTVDRLTTEKP